MSNERIDEILKEKTGVAPDSNAAIPILQAMEQYGKECHADGMREGHSHGIAWAEKYLPELIQLKELAKAQKELIGMHKGEPPHMLHDGKCI